jgi:hypothetical protein
MEGVKMKMNENKEYGYYIKKDKIFMCSVSDKDCKSEQEWNSLIKPYIGE